jgi:hypothetical protein
MFNRREMRRSLRMPRWWDAGEQVSLAAGVVRGEGGNGQWVFTTRSIQDSEYPVD